MSQRINLQTSEYLLMNSYQININQLLDLPRHCRVQQSYGKNTETIRTSQNKDMTK